MRLSTLIISMFLATASTAALASDRSADLATLSDADLLKLGEGGARPQDMSPCKDWVPPFTELTRRHPDSFDYRGRLAASQIFCASEEKRYADGLRLVKQAETEFAFPFYDLFGIYFATELNDGPELLKRLRAASKSGTIVTVPRQTVSAAFASLKQADLRSEADEVAFDLARLPVYARIDAYLQEMLIASALRHAASTGQSEAAERMVQYARSPNTLLTLLVRRDFEPLWPLLEAQAGDHFTKATSAYVSWAAARLADKPEDRDRLTRYADALQSAGRDDETISVAQNWLHRADRAEALEEGDGWALEIEANIWDGRGEVAKADKIFDDLAQLPADDHPWVVNFVINRQGRLLNMGRWEEAVAAGAIAREVAQEHGSPYARAAVAASYGCAYFKLGMTVEGQRELDFLVAHTDDFPGGWIFVLQCAGRDDEAAAGVKELLTQRDKRDSLLRDFPDSRFSFLAGGESVVPTTAALIRSRPDLLAEAMKYVRDLPDRLVPAKNLKAPAAR